MSDPAAPSEPVPPIPAPSIPEPLAPPVPPPPAPDAPTMVATEAPPSPMVAAPPRRRIWPWIVGGAAVVLIIIIVAVVLAVTTFLGTLAAPSKAVTSFDNAYKNSDCTLYQATTTEEFRNASFNGSFDCGQFTDVADSFHDNGVYNYTLDIKSSSISNNTATVKTLEADTSPGEEQTYNLIYTLVRQDGKWVIDNLQEDSIANVG